MYIVYIYNVQPSILILIYILWILYMDLYMTYIIDI